MPLIDTPIPSPLTPSLSPLERVDLKISIGCIGVLIVLVAVVYVRPPLGYSATLESSTHSCIILGVVPFLVLAVGVDMKHTRRDCMQYLIYNYTVNREY